jgi:hypothetical protein
VIRRNPIHVSRRCRDTSKKVAAADDQPKLYAGPGNFSDFLGKRCNFRGIDAERTLSGHHFSGEFEQNATVVRHARPGDGY